MAARNGQEDTSWNFLRAAVFDCPDKSGDDAYVFEKAHVRIIQCVPPDHPFVISLILLFCFLSCCFCFLLLFLFFFDTPQTSVSYMACCSKTHAKRMAHVILRDCGEGIVLRQPESPYHHGRSNALVKIKVFLPPLYPLFLFLSRCLCFPTLHLSSRSYSFTSSEMTKRD